MPTTVHPANTVDRIRRYTSPATLQKIDQQIEHSVAYYASQPDEVIAERIRELQQEWSINRFLQANTAGMGLLGAILGLFVSRKWAILTVAGFGFLACPGADPRIALLRRLGLRTRSEIDRELYALKAARGDFKNLPAERPNQAPIPAHEILQAVNA
jgi:hypothetical protein